MKRVYILVVLNIIVGACTWAFNETLTVMDTVEMIKLRLHGVQTLHTETLDILVRDRCERGRPCRCVALVHGLGDNNKTWGNALLATPKGVRVYAPNMPGTEGSQRPDSPAGWKIPAQSNVLQSVLSGVEGCPSWTVAGNSLGGWTASWLALHWPEGVQKLVLVNSAGLTDSTGSSDLAAKTLASPTIESLKKFTKLAFHQERSIPERVWPDVLGRILRRGTYEIASAITQEDFLDGRLGALKMPVTILWGKSDGVIPLAQAAHFKSEIEHASVVIVENCGHLPQKECPAALIAEIY
ncbi:MAG: hypothetical protein COB53_01795 [Elusimicrobia bacterium]|nr:MAG: hypothetical protein COB53_01795 [Elusimicrobiota bacterium]